MLLFWERIILAPWSRLAPRTACLFLCAAAVVSAQSVEALAQAYRDKPSAATRAALLGFAARHPKDQSGALALLAAGITERSLKQPADAIAHLRAARARLPELADYASYSLAAADADIGDFQAAITDLEPLWNSAPSSPLEPEAAMLLARAFKESGRPADAVALLRNRYASLPQPAGDAALAACARAMNDLAAAATAWQRVYYLHPASGEAEAASAALTELRATLGALYPQASTDMAFQRAERLSRAGDWKRARVEYEQLASTVGGEDRDLARVRIGVVQFLSYQTGAAFNYLSALEVSAREADAERLYYVAEAARRLERDDQMLAAIKRLEEHPQSAWRLKALVSAGNRYLVDNRSDQYVPLFHACYESFPSDQQADYCHWKITWNSYLRRQPDASDLLKEHLVRFPGSERASAALYFLGRSAETANQREAAKAYYSEILSRFPNHYYAEAAGQRLSQPSLFGAVESPATHAYLSAVVWPVAKTARTFDPNPSTQTRIERARLLESAGLDDLAETELRYGARTGNQPHVLAIQLAQVASRYGAPHRAMRLIKNFVPDYLSMPVESAPPSLWRLLFPMPWRTELERSARRNGLDPYMVAGLIRQESEFNPEAVSPARAYGLTQILPSTGRMLLKMSRRRFRPAILFRPEVNLRLGTQYLSAMDTTYSGRWELTLAAYNAGSSRVQNWLTWADYREPAEFIETIPFSETRGYVFAVLRNASMYRKLYSPESSGILASEKLAPPLEKRAVAPTSKKRPFKRNPVVLTHKHRTRHPSGNATPQKSKPAAEKPDPSK